MAEVLIEYEDWFSAADGRRFRARVCGRSREDRMWEAWIEFVPADGQHVLRTGRETTQPSRELLQYWARGLTWGYLDGALLRTLRPARRLAARPTVESKPTFDRPAEWRAAEALPPIAILDPFAVYAKGDDMLRGQLNALPPAQLRNVIRAHRLSDAHPAALETTPKAALIEQIMAAVRDRSVGQSG